MTANQEQLVKMFRNADAKEAEIIVNILFCAATFGEPFYKEMQELLNHGTPKEMREALKKWTETARTKRKE